ncbi:MAG: ABC-F family ATP-binding cassette domain-containing protein [Lachnospira sp.]|nr:ABC-F family ATP-binding cassette domain-containing protein [Lachnospira sp.]
MILACNHISKAFGTDVIIKDCTFHIEDREKAAIIGINGAGKSTLLKIIIGELSADSGNVTIAKDKTIGYLAQHQSLETDNTVFNEVLSVKQDVLDTEANIRSLEHRMKDAAGTELDTLLKQYTRLNHEFEQNNGYAYKSEVTGILKGLGFTDEDFELKVNTLSGGQKTRIALCKLLVSKPDIILLDEPTNHLDMSSIAWLENYLLTYAGSVIIVAHDRYFLDKIVTKIVEIDNGNVTAFTGNYTDYASKKAILRNMKLKEYLNQQRDIKHQEEVIAKLKQFNREKSIKRAESREKMLDKIERIDKPVELNDKMNIILEPQIVSGNDVLNAEGLTKAFDDNVLFSNINFEIKRGERVALIGNNGTGKTTMLKIINGLIPADNGTITLGSNVTIGYYDQEHNVLNPDKTLFEEIQDTYPDLNNTQIRNTLAAFLFTGDEVFKYIRELSGGERGRVSLAKLMLSNANLLILDEPTNHLDITSKEILEKALNSYTGTVLYVSHDRYFINTTATRIIELTGRTVINYIGNYDYYLEKKDTLTKAAGLTVTTSSDGFGGLGNTVSSAGTSASDKASASKADWQQSKEEQARIRKLNNELKKVEARIEELENRIAALDEESADPAICSNTGKLMELHNERSKCAEELEDLYEKWEVLSENASYC